VLALVTLPGRPVRQGDALVPEDDAGSAQWTLDALTVAAQEWGIQIHRSQIRRMFLAGGIRWRRRVRIPRLAQKNGGRHALHRTPDRHNGNLCG
jgi:transposase